MIQLECSNCKTMLSIDDAFAGGVCRCQFCGTIQTVPKPGSGGDSAAADGSSPKPLFKRKARIESALNPYSDSLAKAADEMESSGGLSSNALAGINNGGSGKRASSHAGDGGSGGIGSSQAGVPSPRQSGGIPSPGGSGAGQRASAGTATAVRPQFVPKPSSSATPVSAAASSKMPVIAAAAAVGVLVCAGGIWWVLCSGNKAPQPAPQAVQTVPAPEPKVQPAPPVDTAPKPVAASEPTTVPAPVAVPATMPAPAAPAVASSGSICGIPLEGQSVIYVVDRAGCTPEAFGQVLDACYASILSLGEQRKFGLAVWNDAQELAYPTEDLAVASAASIEECRKLTAKTSAGTSNISGILSAAVAVKPAEIVLVSAVELDDLSAMAIRTQLGKVKGSVKFHGIAVGSKLTGERLQALVKDFGGEFKQVELTALKP